MTWLDLYIAYLAVGVGVLVVLLTVGLMIAFMMTALIYSQDLEPRPLLGSLVRVVAKIEANGTGEVLCMRDDDRRYYPARAADGRSFGVGSMATVSGCGPGFVLVRRVPQEMYAPLGVLDGPSQGECDVDSK
jgi:hypothetical protein